MVFYSFTKYIKIEFRINIFYQKPLNCTDLDYFESFPYNKFGPGGSIGLLMSNPKNNFILCALMKHCIFTYI